MSAPFQVPGRDHLLQQEAALKARKETNLSQIAVLNAENDSIDGRLALLCETIRFSDSLTTVPAIQNFSATPGENSGEIVLNWDNEPGASEYEIQEATLSDFSDASVVFTGAHAEEPVTLAGRTPEQVKYYRIRGKSSMLNDGVWVMSEVIPS